MFCYCGEELKLLSNKNFVCNKCSTVFKECEDGIYSDNNSLYKIYFIESSYEECLIPIETKQEYNECYDEDYSEMDGGIPPEKYEGMIEYTEDEIKGLYNEYVNADVNYKGCKNSILECLGLTARYNDWINNEFEYPDLDENESAPNEFLTFFEEEFSNKVRCEECGSIIDARYWQNLGEFREYEDNDGVEFEHEYWQVSCPICSNIKNIDMKYIVSASDETSKLLDEFDNTDYHIIIIKECMNLFNDES